MDPIRNLQQPLAWNPLDLTDENLPASQDVAIDEGTGFLPDGNCSGDFNGDVAVGSADIVLFLTAYGEPWAGPYDLDDTDMVDAQDLLVFLTLYNLTCE